MFKMLLATVAAAGLFFVGASSQANAGYGVPYCPTPVYNYNYGYSAGYVPVYRPAVVPAVPVYPHYHYGHNHSRGGSVLIRTPGFGFGYYR